MRYYFSMEIRDNNKFYIIAPLNPRLDRRELERIQAETLNENRIIGLDLSYVYDCTIDFIAGLKELCRLKPISIFNINSDVFAIFNCMDTDKYAKLFVSELDFEEDVRQLINRKFLLI